MRDLFVIMTVLKILIYMSGFLRRTNWVIVTMKTPMTMTRMGKNKISNMSARIRKRPKSTTVIDLYWLLISQRLLENHLLLTNTWETSFITLPGVNEARHLQLLQPVPRTPSSVELPILSREPRTKVISRRS